MSLQVTRDRHYLPAREDPRRLSRQIGRHRAAPHSELGSATRHTDPDNTPRMSTVPRCRPRRSTCPDRSRDRRTWRDNGCHSCCSVSPAVENMVGPGLAGAHRTARRLPATPMGRTPPDRPVGDRRSRSPQCYRPTRNELARRCSNHRGTRRARTLRDSLAETDSILRATVESALVACGSEYCSATIPASEAA